jgi:hypothetical protein
MNKDERREQIMTKARKIYLPSQAPPLERPLLASTSTVTAEGGVQPQQILIHCSPFTGCRMTRLGGS